jgi:hypothetical protein
MGLKHVEGKVVVSCDMEGKNWHTFSDGTKIRRERQFDNMNKRESEPVNAIVLSAENIPEGVEILVHPNALIDSNRIHNYAPLSGKEADSDIKYFSIPEDQCFCYREGKEWLPLPPYEKALRVFKPYAGSLEGIPPTMIKDCLYVLTGDLAGKVVLTVKASDYQIVFQDVNGIEGNLIRFRPHGDGEKREPEAIAIHHNFTKKVLNQEYLIGLTTSDCKPLEISAYAD